MDLAQGSPKVEEFALKFDSPELAERFKKHFNDAKEEGDAAETDPGSAAWAAAAAATQAQPPKRCADALAAELQEERARTTTAARLGSQLLEENTELRRRETLLTEELKKLQDQLQQIEES